MRPSLRNFAREQNGSQLVESALILIPLCAMVFLLIDVTWAIFVKATLQSAVREGARYAMTGNTSEGAGQLNSVKIIVQKYSMGLLSGNQSNTIHVQFYAPDLTPVSSNQGGNLVIVSVVNYPFIPLAPFLHNGQTVYLTVKSGDRLETLPDGAKPSL